MTSFRQIHTKIWKDDWFLELEPMNKLFFIYLFSNEQASISGIYELAMRVMSFESGLTMPEIKDAFELFQDARKAFYADGVVWVPNLRKYHETQSPKVQTKILKDLAAVKDCNLKGIYCDTYGIDRVSNGIDSVCIPPYMYTYTSKSSSNSTSKGGAGGKYDSHAENQPPPEVNQALTALRNISKTRFDVSNPPDAIERFAYELVDAEQVDAIGGFSEWWQGNGYYAGKPAVKSVIDEWANYVDGVVVEEAKPNFKNQASGYHVSGSI